MALSWSIELENRDSEKPYKKKGKFISTTKLLLRNEIDYILYRKQWLATQSRKSYNWSRIKATIRSRNSGNYVTEQKIQLLVPYSGKQGHQLLLKIKKQLKKNLPDDIKLMISYRSTKLSTKFPTKGKTYFQHKHNVVYYGKCPNEGYKDDYVGETKKCIVERIKDRKSKDNSSHLLKHARENGYTHICEKGFQILGNNYQSNFKRKISESLFIKQTCVKRKLKISDVAPF